MAQKWTKIVIFWSKYASNDPEFELEVYLSGFYWILKFSTIFDNFWPIFGQKNAIFLLTRQKFCNFFSKEIASSLWKMAQFV